MNSETLKKLQEAAQKAQQAAKATKAENFSGKTGNEAKAETQATQKPTVTTPAPAKLPDITPAQPKPQPKPNREKIALKSFVVDFNEGREDISGKIVTTWQAATELLLSIGLPSIGYYKTQLQIIWKDGTEFCPRVDVGNKSHDFNAGHKSIGEFVKRWFEEEELNIYQFEDEPEAIEAAKQPAPKPVKASIVLPVFNSQPLINDRPEVGTMTVNDLLNGIIAPEEETPAQEPAPEPQPEVKPAPAPQVKPYSAPKPPAMTAAPILPPLEMVRYSADCLVIFGTRTKELRQEIRDLGGKFNPILKYKDTGTRKAGWFFKYSTQKEEEIKEFIAFFL